MEISKKCLSCDSALFEDHFFKLENMPAGAQEFDNPSKVDLEVRQCSHCELVQLTNEPVHSYKDVIRAVGFSDEMKKFREEQFGNFIKENSLYEKKVLEVGCGDGEYLRVMRDAGAETFGLENNPMLARKSRARGLSVYQGYITDKNSRVINHPFDAFFTMNFLEHAPNPKQLLEGIRNNLKEGGVGIVEVPNFDMMAATGHFSEFIGDHLSYFTKSSLTFLLDASGFEVLECSSIWHDYIISATVAKRDKEESSRLAGFTKNKIDFELFEKKKNKDLSSLDKYIRGYEDNSVAVYGAGHQSLALIALSGIGPRLKYIVDDAPFKQGRKSPASNVPIVSANTLREDPAKAIVVIGASYSDEIVDKLTKSGYNNLNIAVLRQEGLKIYK